MADFDIKRERNLVKLLKQIDEIEEKILDGYCTHFEQDAKLERKQRALEELEQIQRKTVSRRLSQISTQASRASLVSRRSLRRSLNIEEDPIGVEDLHPTTEAKFVSRKTEGEKKWHIDIRPFGSYFGTEYSLCLQQIRELSQDCFGSDAAEKCSKRGGWHLTVFTEGQDLLGFIVYKIRGMSLCIANIAVPVEQRRKGYGKALIRWAQGYARTRSKASGLEIVGLSSLKESVPFYKAMGFREVKVTKCYEDDTLIPGQVYMEYRIGKGKHRRN